MALEFSFNLKEAAIYQAVKWERYFRLAGHLKKLFLILFIFLFLIFLYGFLTDVFSQPTLSLALGLSIIFLSLFLGCWLKESFLNSKLKKPKLKATIEEAINRPTEFNLTEFFSFEAAKAVWKSKNNSTALFYNLLCDNPELNFIFSRAFLNLKDIKDQLKARGEQFSADLQKVIQEALKIAQKKAHQRVEKGDMLTALAKYNSVFKKILIESNLKVEDIENLTWWLEDLEEKIGERKRFWEWKNLLKKGSLAKEWAAGFTPLLDRFSRDISELVKKRGFPEIIGHQKEIGAMERILARREINNVLMVGESGSGRKSMIHALAIKSVLGESLVEVNYKRVVQLDLTALISQVKNIEDIGGILDELFKEVMTAGNIVLVIDEFHNFVGEESLLKPGVIDISGIISPYLPFPQFQIVAITTFEGLHKNIERNPSLLSLFEKVEVSEVSERETLILLEDLALRLEAKYRKFVSYPALRDIISYCSKYFPATPFPEKAMDLLDEVMVYLAQTKDKLLLPKHVAKIVSEKTQIPVGEVEAKEREILLNLENLIHQRIINQQEAVKEVSTALRRARAEVTARRGPMGAFLFLGPTGVGKTETAKALAGIYFGAEDKMIRLDMSEFQNVSDISRLIGSLKEDGLLTTQVRETPFSLILLDEIEKAHPNILNLFLQVLDEGHLTDGLGRKIDFKYSIIIATSNAGYQIILEALKQKIPKPPKAAGIPAHKGLGTEWSGVKEKLLDELFEKAIFRPEFINRFDAVVVFRPLSKENLLDIAELMLQKIKKNLEQKDIEFVITQPLKEKIAELSYSPVFGAREMKRVIQDKVENILAQAILSGELKRGSRAEIEPEEFKLIINP